MPYLIMFGAIVAAVIVVLTGLATIGALVDCARRPQIDRGHPRRVVRTVPATATR